MSLKECLKLLDMDKMTKISMDSSRYQFKTRYSLQQRVDMLTKKKREMPNHIPVVVEIEQRTLDTVGQFLRNRSNSVASGSTMAANTIVVWKKYVLQPEADVADVLRLARSDLFPEFDLPEHSGYFLYVGVSVGTMANIGEKLKVMFTNHRDDEDGFLYFRIAIESCFGG